MSRFNEISQVRLNNHKSSNFVKSVNDSSLLAAYMYQKRFCDIERSVSGWKLGGVTHKVRSAFGTSKTYFGPLFTNSIVIADGVIPLPAVFGLPYGEAEVSFRLSNKVEMLQEFDLIDDNNIDLFISGVMPSLELPWSPFNFPTAGLKLLVNDFCASGLLIVSNETIWDSFQRRKLDYSVSISSEGLELANGSVADIIPGPLGALIDFLNLAKEMDFPVKVNQIVATGGCTPCIELPFGKVIDIHFGAFGSFNFSLAKKKQ